MSTDLQELIDDCDSVLNLFDSIKQQIKSHDPNLYERWKAGGFLVDSNIVSMYPSLEDVVESLRADDEDDEDDEL